LYCIVIFQHGLNIELQKALNSNLELKIEKYGQVYAIGDKVMQVENNYDKEVYNGDTGFMSHCGIGLTPLPLGKHFSIINYYGI